MDCNTMDCNPILATNARNTFVVIAHRLKPSYDVAQNAKDITVQTAMSLERSVRIVAITCAENVGIQKNAKDVVQPSSVLTVFVFVKHAVKTNALAIAFIISVKN